MAPDDHAATTSVEVVDLTGAAGARSDEVAVTMDELARLYSDAVQLTEQLREALASRAVIEQAKGVLMAREGIDALTAFTRLRHDSQRRNVKLRNIAQEVVDSTQR